MRRALAILGSAIFLVLAPGTVAGLVPWWISPRHFEFHSLPLEITGALLIAFGGLVLLDSFARFAMKGLGTPAPVFPTRHLVVTGLYRYVRNPMYVAVVALIIGQALIFASVRLLEYGALIWLAAHLFGAEYEAFCRGVSRWIPRLHPY